MPGRFFPFHWCLDLSFQVSLLLWAAPRGAQPLRGCKPGTLFMHNRETWVGLEAKTPVQPRQFFFFHRCLNIPFLRPHFSSLPAYWGSPPLGRAALGA